MVDVSGVCREAVSASGVVRDGATAGDDMTAEVRALASDAVDTLTALQLMLERPLEAARMPGVRKMVEAGVVVAAECAAACEQWDDTPESTRCATANHRCAGRLRELLAATADQDTDEVSGAT